MSKKKKGGESKILLLAAVGVGAFILYKRAGASVSASTGLSTGVNAGSGTAASILPLPAPGVTTTAAASTQLTPGQIQNGITQAYANDAQNMTKINALILRQPQNLQAQAKQWIATTDINQRSFLANYYDYLASGNNSDILLTGTIPFMKQVAAVSASTGFKM